MLVEQQRFATQYRECALFDIQHSCIGANVGTHLLPIILQGGGRRDDALLQHQLELLENFVVGENRRGVHFER